MPCFAIVEEPCLTNTHSTLYTAALIPSVANAAANLGLKLLAIKKQSNPHLGILNHRKHRWNQYQNVEDWTPRMSSCSTLPKNTITIHIVLLLYYVSSVIAYYLQFICLLNCEYILSRK
jgi:hypothetical protein